MRIITKSGDQNMLTWVHYQIALLNFIFGDFDRAAEEINMARPLTLTPFFKCRSRFRGDAGWVDSLGSRETRIDINGKKMYPYTEKSVKKGTKSFVEVPVSPPGRTSSAYGRRGTSNCEIHVRHCDGL